MGVRVLVVEDDFLISMWADDALRDAGFATIVANDAQAALNVLDAEDDIGLLFTDIDMPGAMDGLELASTVKDRWPTIPIIIASGKHRPSSADMPSHAVFLPKPYLSVDMLGAVHRLCPQG